MKRMLCIWLMLFGMCELCQAAAISGIVKTKAGTPLAEVKVLCGRSLRNGFALTEQDGAFSFAVRCPVIYFQRDGYQPQAALVELQVSRLEVVLEDVGSTLWVAPSCPSSVTDKNPGFSLRLAPPAEASVSKGYDVDYGYFSIGYGPKKQRVWLTGAGDGGLATLGVPPEEWLLNSREFSVRAFRSGIREGLDIRGQSKDGTYWRHVGVILIESMSYDGVSAEAAAFFDKLIDSACASGR